MAEGLFERFSSRPGVTEEQIASAEEVLRVTLPGEYRRFLKVRNGGEGLIGQTYVMLWDIAELGRNCRAYERGCVGAGPGVVWDRWRK